MRTVPSYISERLNKNIQTRANKSAPSASLWVGRPTTAMVDDAFLERQTVVASANTTDVSIAVCHPRANSGNTRIDIAYISNGAARVLSAVHRHNMSAHIWRDAGFYEKATAVSIAYDGTMPKSTVGNVEFVTGQPWVFWVNDGALYGRILISAPYSQRSDGVTVLLAEANCTDVSAIRAMWSSAGGFDFGLVVFFLLRGEIYYRQLIDGVWMDAEKVSLGPSITLPDGTVGPGVIWSEIAAFRTWDYRIGVQAKATTGRIYELFTQFMGVGKQLTEHLAVDVEPKANYVAIDYTDVKSEEHIEAHVSASGHMTYGLSSVPVAAYNVDDGTGNYGTTIHVKLDHPVTNVDGNVANFSLADSNGDSYICTDVGCSEDGLTLILTFMDFNQAEDTTLTVEYVPGTIMSPATAMESFSYAFAPENLEKVDIPLPEPVKVWNLDSEGAEVAIRFSQPLVGDIAGNEARIVVTGQTYDYVPGGDLKSVSIDVVSVSRTTELYPEDSTVVYLKFEPGNTKSLRNMVGPVSIAYSNGTLRGQGGRVKDFTLKFTPTNLEPKHHPNADEHVETVIEVKPKLTRIYYTDTSESEHIEAVVRPVGNLISIDDI